MREILSDLVAEEQALDQFLQKIPIRDWKRKVGTADWSIQDVVAFLATAEEFALQVIEHGRSALDEALAFGTFENFVSPGIERGRSIRPQDVIEWWRAARAGVVDALSRMRLPHRIPWFTGDIAAQTFATTRLAETWEYGLDIQAAVHAEIEDTPRLRHIAWLAWQSLPYAFSHAGHEYRPVRVEVIGPGYAKWVFGPEGSESLIKGPAGDWCRLAVGRIDLSATSLKAIGDDAELALRFVSTAIR